MKRKSTLILIAGNLCIYSFLSAFFLSKAKSTATLSDDCIYIMSESDGYICIYDYKDATKSEILLDCEVSHLPEQDRAMLREGIAISNEYELRRLIEDFTG